MNFGTAVDQNESGGLKEPPKAQKISKRSL